MKISIRVLVAEDEPKVQRFIRSGLEYAEMTVDTVDTLEDLKVILTNHSYDVLVLDRLLKKMDSIFGLKEFKRLQPNMKIIILSALGEVDERVKGLESGANDYLTKPFHISELIARIRNLAHQTDQADLNNSKKYQFKDLTLNLENQSVRRGAELITLTSKEFKILSLLMGSPLKIFSKSEILDRVWNINQDTESNVVEVAMNRLRSKINIQGLEPLIYTKRGGGYSLSLEDS